MALGLPHDEAPTGWYQVCWSDELEIGATRPMRYFGRDLAAYRGHSGAVFVSDAFCPHLGAHLGHGGQVDGDDIVCPFHGWRFDCQGNNTEIPYADRPNRAKKLKTWPTRDINGWIMVWFDAAGGEPTWEPPVVPEATGDTHQEIGRRFHAGARIQPQPVVENIVDALHQVHVHDGTHPLEIYQHEADGHVFRVRSRLRVGVGRSKTWLTPDGEALLGLDMETDGLGIWISRHLQDGALHAQNVTPIDAEHSNSFATIYVPRSDDEETLEVARRRFNFQMKHLEKDMVIWTHMRFEPRPPWSQYEAKPYAAFRNWAAQFYPDNQPTTTEPEPAAASR